VGGSRLAEQGNGDVDLPGKAAAQLRAIAKTAKSMFAHADDSASLERMLMHGCA
jgi:hypothetical protein